MKLLYHGPLWSGTTSLQRVDAFRRIEALDVIAHDTGESSSRAPSIWSRIRWKIRWPIDRLDENRRLIAVITEHSPDVVMVDNSKVLKRSTLRELRRHGASRLIYYSPDDMVAPHNLSYPLQHSLPDWDVVFTTKTYNVAELAERGVKRPVLVGNAFAPEVHRPLSRLEVGPEFERFDLVFIGTYEEERFRSINRLAQAGFSVVIYGSGWKGRPVAKGVLVRGAVYADEYARAMHHGRLALCFLRKINRDRITQRSTEVPGMGRPMVAERTDEHEAHFLDGVEYVGFSSDEEMIERVQNLLHDDVARIRIALAGRQRCQDAGYSTDARARFMISVIESALRD